MILDQKTRDKLAPLYPDFRVRCIRVIGDMERTHGLILRVTHSLRSLEEQKALYEQGRSEPGKIVTNAKPGFSLHNYGVALDVCFDSRKDPYLEKNDRHEYYWEEFGRFCKAHGMSWGGDFHSFPDRPHCEIRYGGMSVEEMREIYEKFGIKGVWIKFDRIRGLEAGAEWSEPGEIL